MAVGVEVHASPALRAQLRHRRGSIADTARVSRIAAEQTCRAVGVDHAELSITWLTDEEITALNEDYLKHRGPTDVISFELYEPGELPVGDIYIGYDYALAQAAALGEDPAVELMRLAVHGTLHVLGFDHPKRADREESAMWLLQEAIVAEVVAS
jgi:probable rRNA maturation factor